MNTQQPMNPTELARKLCDQRLYNTEVLLEVASDEATELDRLSAEFAESLGLDLNRAPSPRPTLSSSKSTRSSATASTYRTRSSFSSESFHSASTAFTEHSLRHVSSNDLFLSTAVTTFALRRGSNVDSFQSANSPRSWAHHSADLRQLGRTEAVHRAASLALEPRNGPASRHLPRKGFNVWRELERRWSKRRRPANGFARTLTETQDCALPVKHVLQPLIMEHSPSHLLHADRAAVNLAAAMRFAAFASLRQSQSRERQRFESFHACIHGQVREARRDVLANNSREEAAQIVKLRSKHPLEISDLEDRQLAAEIDLQNSQKIEGRNLSLALFHIDGYFANPDRDITQAALKQRDAVRLRNEQLETRHRAAIDVLRAQQARQMRSKQDSQAAEILQVHINGQKTMEEMEYLWTIDDAAAEAVIRRRWNCLAKKWKIAIDVWMSEAGFCGGMDGLMPMLRMENMIQKH